MSQPPDDEDIDGAFNEPIELIVHHEQVIKDAKDLLHTSLEENLHNVSFTVDRSDVIYSVESVLEAVTSGSQDVDTHELAHAILYTVTAFDKEILGLLDELDADDELIQLLAELSARFGDEAQAPVLKSFEGRNFWNRLNSELVVRDDDNIGINHHMLLRFEEEVEISTSLDGTLRLVESLLDSIVDSNERFGSESAEQMSYELLESISDDVEQIKSDHADVKGGE